MSNPCMECKYRVMFLPKYNLNMCVKYVDELAYLEHGKIYMKLPFEFTRLSPSHVYVKSPEWCPLTQNEVSS